MKSTYITPSIEICPLLHSSALCAGSSPSLSPRITSDIGLSGGDHSGNVADAF